MDHTAEPSQRIILASSSPYKCTLLKRLSLTFEIRAPALDETVLPGEDACHTSARLARAKAKACAATVDQGLIIGADQTAALGREIIGKPRTHQRAVAQLQASSGRQVSFFTAVHLLDLSANREWCAVDETVVYFRSLSAREIEAYLQREQPYDCAGSFKAEALGISLFQAIETRDPSALTGLPLIALSQFLRKAGVPVP